VKVPTGWDTHVHVFEAGAPARAGHYAPQPAPLHEIEALAAAHGIGHLVIVQPSVYGTDNGVLLRALRQSPGRHRGVAVVDASVSDRELDELHEAGVRGVRFNLVSPVGNGDAQLQALAPRLARRGWHVQWYAPAGELARLAELQRSCGLVFVLDHLGGLDAQTPENDAAWGALAQLARAGAWIKLSGWYRMKASAPYRELHPAVARAAALFGTHTVWGSDWPHTWFEDRADCAYESMLAPLQEALPAAAVQAILHTQPTDLYA
jgi:predicted TIM-barrel fold metal-dependent hydrolase